LCLPELYIKAGQKNLPKRYGCCVTTILVVEDEELIRAALAFTLTAEGYEVLGARDGQEGVEIFAQQPEAIDLVLSDFRLPHLNGLEMLQILKGIRPQVKVILITGFPGGAQSWLEQGGYDWLTKPFGTEQLLDKVAAALVPSHRIIAVETPSGTVSYPIAILEDTADSLSWFVQVDTNDLLAEGVYPAVLQGGARCTPGQYIILNVDVAAHGHTLRGIFQLTSRSATTLTNANS
jgi:CheY-like chemotaxis protein